MTAAEESNGEGLIAFANAKPTNLSIDNSAEQSWDKNEKLLRKANHIEVGHHFCTSVFKIDMWR